MRRVALVLSVLAAVRPALAQEARLHSRMDAETYRAVRVIIDSARKAGLPTRPIEDKALEGASSGAPGPTIISATREFTAQLAAASMALGRKARTGELRAAVAAIDAGVPSRDLIRIRAAADPGDRSIATALTVMGDVVVRGVPVATASNLVISLLRAKVKDPALLEFDRAVQSDLAKGADPATAAAARARGAILAHGISK